MAGPRKKDLVEVVVTTLFVGGVLMNAVPLFAMFVLGGAENEANFVKFFLYTSMGVLSILAVVVIRLVESQGFFETHPELKPFSRMTVHSPEHTLVVKTLRDINSPPLAKRVAHGVANTITKPQRLLLVFLVIGLGFGSLVAITGTFVAGTPNLVEGQITEGGQLTLAVEPAVSSETMFFNVFLLYMQAGAIAWLLIERVGLGFLAAYIIGKTVSVILTTVEFVSYHIFRYGTEEVAVVSVGLLGLITNILTAVTDSMIPAYMIHGSGNFFKKLSELGIFTNEFIIAGTVVAGLIVVAVYIVVLRPWNN